MKSKNVDAVIAVGVQSSAKSSTRPYLSIAISIHDYMTEKSKVTNNTTIMVKAK